MSLQGSSGSMVCSPGRATRAQESTSELACGSTSELVAVAEKNGLKNYTSASQMCAAGSRADEMLDVAFGNEGIGEQHAALYCQAVSAARTGSWISMA